MTLGHPNSERLPAPDRISETNIGRQLVSHRDAMPFTKENSNFWRGAFREQQSRQMPHGFGNPIIHGDGATKHHAGLGDHKRHPNSRHAEHGDRKHHANADHMGKVDGKHHRYSHDHESRSARAGHQRHGHEQTAQHHEGKGGHGSLSGRMSWYGKPQKTANGGWFDPEGHTVASKTLPFGTHLRIHGPNGKSVEATVTDRGPYVAGRNLDVSRRIARELGFTNAGVAHYSAEVLSYGSGGHRRHRHA